MVFALKSPETATQKQPYWLSFFLKKSSELEYLILRNAKHCTLLYNFVHCKSLFSRVLYPKNLKHVFPSFFLGIKTNSWSKWHVHIHQRKNKITVSGVMLNMLEFNNEAKNDVNWCHSHVFIIEQNHKMLVTQCWISITLENVRKPLIFWRFHRNRNGRLS